MQKQEIVEGLAALEAIIDKHDGFVVEEADRIRLDLNVPPVEKLREHLASLDEEQRLLSIGIIGRVKAGKSSLLNAVLFGGQDILPKAATPMTASLAIVTHGEQFAAAVEYFSPQDIAQIEAEHRSYADALARRIGEIKREEAEKAVSKGTADKPRSSIEEVATRRANREFKEHRWAASFDQYERMKKSGKLGEMKGRQTLEERISANDLEALKIQLGRYVGSDGDFMPFTKSIRMELPMESLRNIQVVDTPGVNDPVMSREQRTQEFLKKCDVVLVVSPAGQFLSREDTDLMDRVTAREGVREMYIVAAQADTQLHGDVLDRSQGNLSEALNMLRMDLSGQANTVLSTLKSNFSEIGDTFDQLIEGGEKRVMVTSAISHAMLQRFDQRQSWDEGMEHHWHLFKTNYPDHFNSDLSARQALGLLANIDTVKGGIEAARQSRDAIIENKRADYLAGQLKTIIDFRDRLQKAIQLQMEAVRNTELSEIMEQKKGIEKMVVDGGDAVDEAFEESLEQFKATLRETVQHKARLLFAETRSESSESVKTTTETRTKKREKGGAMAWVARKIWGGGSEEHTYTEETTTVRSSTVKGLVNKLVEDLQEEVFRAVSEAKRDWKRSVQTQVITQLQNATDDSDQLFNMMKKALRTSVNSMQLPDMEIDYPFENDRSGVLKDQEAEAFMEDVNNYLDELRSRYRSRTTTLINNMVKAASTSKMSDLIFSDMRGQLEALESGIKDKHMTLGRLQRCHNDLGQLSA